MPSVLEDAFVLPGWRRQDRLRVRPQVRGHVAKVRRRRTRMVPRYRNSKQLPGGVGGGGVVGGDEGSLGVHGCGFVPLKAGAGRAARQTCTCLKAAEKGTGAAFDSSS